MPNRSITEIELFRTEQSFSQYRPFSIFINKKKVADIKQGQTIIVNSMPGETNIQVKVDFRKSNILTFNPSSKEKIKITIGKKEVDRKQKAIGVALVAFFTSVGFTVYAPLGGVLGFWVGYWFRDHVINQIYLEI